MVRTRALVSIRYGGHANRRPHVPATHVTTEADRTGYTVTLPLDARVPGDYVLTVEARVGTHVQQRQLPLKVE